MMRAGKRPAKFTLSALIVSLLALSALAGCGSSGPKPLTGQAAITAGDKLQKRVIPPPVGYHLDKTPGAYGTMDATVFDSAGGVGSAAKVGFIVGYKLNYVNQSTGEGITVTLIQFRSSADATAYFTQTAPKTLTFAAATQAPFAAVPGAVAFDGTKEYAGEYSHGVGMTNGAYYALLVYVNAAPGPAPIELNLWAHAQYILLGAKA